MTDQNYLDHLLSIFGSDENRIECAKDLAPASIAKTVCAFANDIESAGCS
jgi:hypothetical protein